MTTSAINEVYKDLDGLMGLPYEQKNATTLKKFILISTDKKSLETSEKILNSLIELKSSLPFNEGNPDIEKIKEILNTANYNLLKINSMFDFVKSIFDLGDNEGSEVSIDDNIMYDFLANMERSKDLLTYISDYLLLITQIGKANSGEKIKYTCDELMEFLHGDN